MTSLNAEASSLSSREHQIQLRRAVIASTIGTAIEWYDFFLYSTVTGLVFAKLFFPHSARIGRDQGYRKGGQSHQEQRRDQRRRQVSFGDRDCSLYRDLRHDYAGRDRADDRLNRQGHFRGI
jgi:hypothetical protein